MPKQPIAPLFAIMQALKIIAPEIISAGPKLFILKSSKSELMTYESKTASPKAEKRPLKYHPTVT
ncbi:MAG: hypothetical protein LUJ09_00150 [Firmicutes bacterium]|nr:hypothetical protein [Bacillota bacterium]